MADIKISALPAVGSALTTDFFPVVQGGTTSKETVLQVRTLFGFNSGTGILALAQGGTAVSSVTVTPTATSFAGWDANKNLSANNFLSGYASTATAAATTTLLVGSAYQQFFTGSTTQTVLLPVASTLALGHSFFITNLSSGVVTVQSSGGNTIQAMAAGTSMLVRSILTSGTTAASWAATYFVASSLTLPLSIANGGTGVTSVTTAPTASAFAGWNANSNLSANNFLAGYATTATAGGVTTLTIASKYLQYFTGTLAQQVNMPDTTLLVLGHSFLFTNQSTGVLTLFASNGSQISTTIPAGSSALVTCTNVSLSANNSWNVQLIQATALSKGLALGSGVGGSDGSSLANASDSIAYGNSGNGAFGTNSFAFGNACTANGNFSYAFGAGSSANADHSIAIGNTGLANGLYSRASGNACTATGDYSWALGNNSTATNAGSVVWKDSLSSGNNDFAANQFNLGFAGGYFFFEGDINIATGGKGINIASGGSAPRIGQSTLTAGTVTVSNTSITANTLIFITSQDANTIGPVGVQNIVVGTSFDIVSATPTDSGVVAWLLIEAL